MITSTDKQAILAARAIDDKASGLPTQSLPCKCGGRGITVIDDAADLVRCVRCGLVQHAGDVAATLRVYRETTVDGKVSCECSPAVEAAITTAKVDAAKATAEGKVPDEKTAKLAALTVEEKPKEDPKDPKPAEPDRIR